MVTAAAAAAKSLQSCPLCATLWTAAHQAPLSLGFSRQEYWSGLPFLSPVTEYIFLGFKITADGDCSHEIKRSLLLGRKVVTNLDSILKNRDITLPTKVHIVKAMAFPVVMYGYESWTIKKSEHQRIDDFELWCCRRPLRIPWTARRSNQ